LKDVAKLLNAHVDAASHNQLLLTLYVEYADLRGRRFKSPAVVAWDALRGHVSEVRPEPIKRC